LGQTPVVVVSERIAQRARELGCSEVTLASNVSDQGLLQAICDLVRQQRIKPA